MTQKPRIIMARLVKREEANRDFDLEFWNKIGVQKKFEAAWEMICDLPNWKPSYVHQQRLRRSVASLKRRES